MRYLPFAAISLMLMFSACVYEPEQFVESETSVKTSEVTGLFSVNDGKQICNPSMSQDTVDYPASMLWLNTKFSSSFFLMQYQELIQSR